MERNGGLPSRPPACRGRCSCWHSSTWQAGGGEEGVSREGGHATPRAKAAGLGKGWSQRGEPWLILFFFLPTLAFDPPPPPFPSGMHVQQTVLTNGSVHLMLEFELWAPRSVGTSGVLEVGRASGRTGRHPPLPWLAGAAASLAGLGLDLQQFPVCIMPSPSLNLSHPPPPAGAASPLTGLGHTAAASAIGAAARRCRGVHHG